MYWNLSWGDLSRSCPHQIGPINRQKKIVFISSLMNKLDLNVMNLLKLHKLLVTLTATSPKVPSHHECRLTEVRSLFFTHLDRKCGTEGAFLLTIVYWLHNLREQHQEICNVLMNYPCPISTSFYEGKFSI